MAVSFRVRDGVLIMRVMSRPTIALATAGPFAVLLAGEGVAKKICRLFPSHPWRQECHLAARMTAPAAAKAWSAPRLRGRQRSNEAGATDRCFFILFTIKSCTININEKILVVKRLRYDRVRCIVAVWLHVPDFAPSPETSGGYVWRQIANNLTKCLMPVVSQSGRAGAHP